MFTNPLQASNNVQDTINKLMAQVDTNQDGVVSNQEFGTFLSSLLKPTTDPTGTTADASNPTSSTNAGSSSSTSAMPSLPLAPNANMTFEGFDLTRVQDSTVSAKDSFAQAAKLAASMPSTKADSEQWFEQNIRASMEADGLTINWIKGHKFEFTNWQGTYVVDFVRGAGGTSPALSWQASVSSGSSCAQTRNSSIGSIAPRRAWIASTTSRRWVPRATSGWLVTTIRRKRAAYSRSSASRTPDNIASSSTLPGGCSLPSRTIARLITPSLSRKTASLWRRSIPIWSEPA